MKSTTHRKPPVAKLQLATPTTKLPVIKIPKIDTIAITDEKSMQGAVSVLSMLNTALDKLTTDKEKLTKPMNEVLKEIRSRYAPKIGELEDAIAYVRKQMTTYQTEETKRLATIAEQIAEKAGTELTFEEASTEIGALVKPDSQVRTAQGMVSFRTVPTYEVQDITKVPYEYLVVDMAKVKKATAKIPGILYGTEQQAINRR